MGVEPTMADLQSAALASWLRRLSQAIGPTRVSLRGGASLGQGDSPRGTDCTSANRGDNFGGTDRRPDVDFGKSTQRMKEAGQPYYADSPAV